MNLILENDKISKSWSNEAFLDYQDKNFPKSSTTYHQNEEKIFWLFFRSKEILKNSCLLKNDENDIFTNLFFSKFSQCIIIILLNEWTHFCVFAL